MKRFAPGILMSLFLIMMATGVTGTAAAQNPPATEAPPVTEIPPEDPPATEPSATDPPATEVPPTVAPATEPPPVAESATREPGMLVNGVALCPPGLAANQIDPAECTEPAAGIEFYAANPNTDNVAFGETRGDGLVSFPLDQFAIGGDQGATVEVGLILGSDPYGAISGAIANCEPANTGLMNSAVQPGGATLAVQYQELIQGDQIACEWFLSHGEPADDGDDDSGETDAPPVTQLPTTGTGAAGDAGRDGVWIAGAIVVAALVGGAVTRAALRLLPARFR